MRMNSTGLTLLAAGLLMMAVSAYAADMRKLEVVATMEHGPGNIAVTEDGTVIVTEHPGLSPVIEAVAIRNGATTLAYHTRNQPAERCDHALSAGRLVGAPAQGRAGRYEGYVSLARHPHLWRPRLDDLARQR